MRNSQQEIAAPKICCNRYCKNVAIAASTVSLTILFSLLLFIFTANKFSGIYFISSVVFCSFFALIFVASIIMLIITKSGKNLLTILIFSLLCAILTLSLYFIKKHDFVINFTEKSTFKLSMLIAILYLIAIVALGIYQIIINKEKVNILTALLSILFALTVIFSSFFYEGSEFGKGFNYGYLIGYVIISVLAQALICVIISLTMTEKKVITTKWLTYCATFSALSVICKIIGNSISFLPTLRFTFVYIPWVISGMVLGPIGGVVSAAIGDVLGQLIMPAGIGALNPWITLGNALFAFFPAIMYKYAPKKLRILFLSIGILLSTLICTLGINSHAIFAYYSNIGYWEFFVTYRLPQAIVISVNYVLILLLIPALEKTKTINLKILPKPTASHLK